MQTITFIQKRMYLKELYTQAQFGRKTSQCFNKSCLYISQSLVFIEISTQPPYSSSHSSHMDTQRIMVSFIRRVVEI